MAVVELLEGFPDVRSLQCISVVDQNRFQLLHNPSVLTKAESEIDRLSEDSQINKSGKVTCRRKTLNSCHLANATDRQLHAQVES